MFLIAIVAALGWSPIPNDWTVADTVGESVVASATLLDGLQTEWHLQQGGREWNPFLGARPSRPRLYGMGLLEVLLHVGIATILPPCWRGLWQGIFIGYHAWDSGYYIKQEAGLNLAF